MRKTFLMAMVLTGVGLWAFAAPMLSAETEPATRPPGESVKRQAPQDVPIETYRRELLNLAMDAASKMPLVPHLKNRSRAQHEVAQAALTLEQPRLALEYLERIDNWRRGALAAEYALYCVRHEHEATVEHYVRLAKATAELANQDWRRDQIHLTIAQVRLLQGDAAPAESFEKNLQTDAFRGRIERTHVEHQAAADDYERMIGRLDQLVEVQLYDQILNGSRAYVALYRRHYSDETKRQEIERKLREAYRTMPGPETIDLLLMLADVAMGHSDRETALGFLDEARKMYDEMAWSPNREYLYVYASKLARARHAAGDASGSRALVEAASRRYADGVEEIYNMWRAACLRPLAEAYVTLGDAEAAAEHYANAVEAGMLNPNGRPRAVDLARTCTSMALVGFQPNDDLLRQIKQAHSRLSSPW